MMGCDIHIVVEARDGINWVGVHATPWIREPRDSGGFDYHRLQIRCRDYNFFTELASVRGEGRPAKGLPRDASPLVKMLTNEKTSWDHSHSWDTAEDFVKIFRKHNPAYINVSDEDILGIDNTISTEFRVVYWFDS